MPITLGSNIPSLQAQRRLGQAALTLESSLGRLSSGLRINRASDDAAGLSISEALNVDARVVQQGVRNLGDGISMLNIASGAVEELKNINVRLEELAQQSANGVLSNRQRTGLNKESEALTSEYNRIVKSTTFNGITLFDHSSRFVDLEAGGSSLTASLGGEMRSGDGTFQAARTYIAAGSSSNDLQLADIDRDGVLDMIATEQGSDTITFSLGNGDGTFRTSATALTGFTNPKRVLLEDLTNDGVVDLLAYDDNSVFVYANNGSGSFAAIGTFAAIGVINSIDRLSARDLNGDGELDLALPTSVGVSISFGNGDGSFVAPTVMGSNSTAVGIGDVNNDGRLDILANYNAGSVRLFLGNGNGTFFQPYSVGLQHSMATSLADFNNDGFLDMVLSNGFNPGYYRIQVGNGDGTFKDAASFGTGPYPGNIQALDVNSDGIMDLAMGYGTAGSGSIGVLLGNGDLTFSVGPSFAGSTPRALSIGDLNGDGIMDLAANFSGVGNRSSIFLGNGATQTVSVAALQLHGIDVSTQYHAKLTLDRLRANANSLAATSAALGVSQQRAAFAVSVLQTTALNDTEARSRITDADVALESAEVVRKRILQQSASAVLGQANQSPALALQLLGVS